ncbi:hypothetical protein RIF29_25310 [Crotalaria pallida]|uniref:DUF8039 domain-containing protein n=1 Tax=Crotalaria pallida TaxID=3830 RepID=A0AAN9ELC6_CROPI
MRSVILERSRNNRPILVEWNPKGQPIGKNASRFNSYIGVVTKRDASINIDDWRDEENKEVKEEIWQDIVHTWTVDESNKAYVLSKAGIALNRFRHMLTEEVRNGCVDEPPEGYADIITKEEWVDFVARCNDPTFMELSAANKVRGSKAAECPSRISRKGYAKLEQEILEKTQSKEAWLPRHELFRVARLDKTGHTNNPKAREIIGDIGINPCVLLDKHGHAIAKGNMYNLEGDTLHGKELPPNHLRVVINYPIDENASLPIEDEMENIVTVGDAVNASIAWPINLISNEDRPMPNPICNPKKKEASWHTNESIISPKKNKGKAKIQMDQQPNQKDLAAKGMCAINVGQDRIILKSEDEIKTPFCS